MGMSSHSVPVPLVAGATQVLAGRPTRYKGVVVRETSGVALTLRLFDNPAAASGTVIDVITVAANGVAQVYLPDDGVACASGLFLERVAGTNFEGSVRLG